jgi:transcriptional antiterminator NusG
MKKEWYVVNTVSGYEYKVKEKLEMMIVNSPEIQESIFRVIVPEQTIVEYKDGVKKERIKKMFPGYVLVEMIMSDEVWFIVRNTQGVTGFIGSSGKGAKPIPLMPDEVDRILSNMGMSRIDLAKDLAEGKKVRITDGPFKNMIGKVSSYDLENKKVELLLDLFGQETSVEVKLSEIENLK